MAGKAPILVSLDCGAGAEALAGLDPAEARPGAEWGAGASAPVMAGPAPGLVVGAKLSVQKLIELGVGNAHLLTVGTAMDGPAAGFGRRFWSWLNSKAPLEISAMQSSGVRSFAYSDRYLLVPYTLRLLAEVVKSAPGAAEARKEITLAFADRSRDAPRFLHDTFPSDTTRREVMRQMMPGAQVNLLSKSQMDHGRSLTITLNDGRQLTLHLDQGFGGWRVDGAHRHDFGAPEAAQAKAIAAAAFPIVGEGMIGAPIALGWH